MRMFKAHSLLLGSLFAIAACGSAKPAATENPRPTTATSDPSCPVAVAGTSVTVEDADNGAALVFVTTGDVAELRRRTNEMAMMHNEHHASMGPLPDGKDTASGHAGHDMGGHDMGSGAGGHAGHEMGSGHDMGGHAGHAAGMIGIHSRATASEIEGGAKLLFVTGAADVAKLQSELRTHAQHLATGTCAMAKS